MGKMEFIRPEDRTFLPMLETLSEERLDRMTPEHRREISGMARCVRYPGGPDQINLYEVRFEPGIHVASHAHAVDEIMVVTEGEIQFGKQVYGLGSSVLIPEHTLYSFRAGHDGLTLMNFRPSADRTVLYKDEFMRSQKDTPGDA